MIRELESLIRGPWPATRSAGGVERLAPACDFYKPLEVFKSRALTARAAQNPIPQASIGNLSTPLHKQQPE